MPQTLTDQELFAAVRAGDYAALDQLYLQHRAAFVSYAGQRLYATEEDAVDSFQDAVIAFYKNAATGRLTELTCSLRTYLFAVGKRLVYRRNQQRHRETPTDHEAGEGRDPADELDLSLLNRLENDEQREALALALSRLGDNCRQILHLFYYQRYPIESIQDTLGYSSPGAVRIKKMRCLETLRKHVSA